MIDVGVLFGVKIVLFVGKMFIIYVGVVESKYFDFLGIVVDDVNVVEKWVEFGIIILLCLVYKYCD